MRCKASEEESLHMESLMPPSQQTKRRKSREQLQHDNEESSRSRAERNTGYKAHRNQMLMTHLAPHALTTFGLKFV